MFRYGTGESYQLYGLGIPDLRVQYARSLAATQVGRGPSPLPHADQETARWVQAAAKEYLSTLVRTSLPRWAGGGVVQPREAMELLLPIEMEAREMVSALLDGLPKLFG